MPAILNISIRADKNTIMSQTIALLAFDLDDTVLQNHAKPSKQTLDAFQKAHDKGIMLSAATGRAFDIIPDEIKNAPWCDFCVTCNGARVYDAHTHEELFACPIEYQDLKELFCDLSALHPAWNMYVAGKPYNEIKSLLRLLRKRKELDKQAASSKSLAAFGHIVAQAHLMLNASRYCAKHAISPDKITATFKTKADCDAAQKILEQKNLDFARFSRLQIEITAKHVTKGTAIEKLCQMLHINQEHVVCFGDSGNDISMANKTFRFVAVANAQPEILQRADEVCPSVPENGVAQWICTHLEN